MSTGESERTPAEKITMLGSLAILLGILALTAWAGIRDGGSRPVIEAEAHLDRVRVIGSAYYVPITVTNTGGLTAQDVTVSGELSTGDSANETAEITITFLAGAESEDAEMIFSEEPNADNLTIVPVSYIMP